MFTTSLTAKLTSWTTQEPGCNSHCHVDEEHGGKQPCPQGLPHGMIEAYVLTSCFLHTASCSCSTSVTNSLPCLGPLQSQTESRSSSVRYSIACYFIYLCHFNENSSSPTNLISPSNLLKQSRTHHSHLRAFYIWAALLYFPWYFISHYCYSIFHQTVLAYILAALVVLLVSFFLLFVLRYS